MKKLLCSFLAFGFITTIAPGASFVSCGSGYILTPHSKIDGIKAEQCQKLWCRDLETGRAMGSGTSPNNGYKSTNSPIQLCDAAGNCIECFGERRWCSGEAPGEWNSKYGVYLRSDGNTTFLSYQKGGCFAWHLKKPECPDGETAILKKNDKGEKVWTCSTPARSAIGSRASGVRRTGTTLRRPLR